MQIPNNLQLSLYKIDALSKRYVRREEYFFVTNTLIYFGIMCDLRCYDRCSGIGTDMAFLLCTIELHHRSCQRHPPSVRVFDRGVDSHRHLLPGLVPSLTLAREDL